MLKAIFPLVFVSSVSLSHPVFRECNMFYEESAKVSSSVLSNDFSTERTALEYLLKFSIYNQELHSLSNDLLRLNRDDVVIDFGSGEGNALAGFYQNLQSVIDATVERSEAGRLKFDQQVNLSHFLKSLNASSEQDIDPMFQAIKNFFQRPIDERPRGIGISFKMRTNREDSDRLQFITNRLFEDIRAEEIPEYSLGLAYYGVPAYTKHISTSLQTMLSRLKVGGKLYIYGLDSVVVEPSQLDRVLERYKKESLGSVEGTAMDYWLKSNAKGIKVNTTLGQNFGVIVIERTQDPLFIPELVLAARIGQSQQPPNYVYVPLKPRN